VYAFLYALLQHTLAAFFHCFRAIAPIRYADPLASFSD